MHSTPIYHAQIGPLTGLLFPVGDSWLFTSADDSHVYEVTHLQAMTLRTPVDEATAQRLHTTVIEPRLHALGGRQS